MRDFIRATAAGALICTAAIVYLNCKDAFIGSMLFAFGLLTIVVYRLVLFTGVIGYLAEKRPFSGVVKHFLLCVIAWLGNLAGVVITAVIYRNTRAIAGIDAKLNAVVSAKLGDSYLSLFLLGICCGVLMFIAVNTYKQKEFPEMARVFTVFLCVIVFILSGHEHSIADMGYFALYARDSILPLLKIILVVTLGNTVGGMAACIFKNLCRHEDA